MRFMEQSDGRCLLCSICYVTLALQSPSAQPFAAPRCPSLPLVLVFPLLPSSHESFGVSFPLRLVRSSSSQDRASSPSYIQQTPSIYSFELDGSKGKVAGCHCVNFQPLKQPVFLSLFFPSPFCFFALTYRRAGIERNQWRSRDEG